MLWKRILLTSGLLIIALMAAVLLSLRFLPETELIRKGVQDKLTELTGRQIVIGSIKFTSSFSNLITLNLDRIVVMSHDGGEVASVDRLILAPSLKGLLNRELSIKSATVTGLRARFERTAEGTVKDPLGHVVAAGISQVTTEAKHPVDTKASARAESDTSESSALARKEGVKWSVRSLALVDCRIDWIDRLAAPGKAISLIDISGHLTQQGAGEPVSVLIASRLDPDISGTGLIRLEGQILPIVDFSSLEGAILSLAVEKAPADILRPYFPTWWTAGSDITQFTLQGRIRWEKGQSPKFSLTTEIVPRSGPSAKIDCQGELIAADDLSDVRQLRISGETDALPLKLIATLRSIGFPFDPEQVLIKAKINGEWNRKGPWQLRGTTTLENVVAPGALPGIGHPVRVDAEFRMDPDNLFLDKTEFWESGRLASIIGKIEQPFSAERVLDLSGNAIIQSQWLPGFGVKFPKAVDIRGPIPVQARVRGRSDAALIDLNGDITNAAVRWAPHLEKLPGNAASVSLKGKVNAAPEKKDSRARFNGEAHFRIAGARVGLADHAPRLEKSTIHFDSKVLVNGKTTDLKNASLTLKGGPASTEMLSATANVLGLGSTPKFNGSAVAQLNSDIIALLGLQMPTNMVLKGSSQLKAGFSGDINHVSWTLDAPLTKLDIATDRSFRKPAGVAGDVKASGKWSKDSLALVSSRLTLPGVSVTADGDLRDRTGKLKDLKIELKKSNAKDIARFVPATEGFKLSGPVEATVHVRPGDKGMVAGSEIRLLSVDCRPAKSTWGLEKLQGKIEIQGTNLVADDITGRVNGAMEGPLKISAVLNHFSSPGAMLGTVSLHIGTGRFKAEQLRNTLNKARILIGSLLNPGIQNKGSDLMEFESLGGDFEIKSGIVHTLNLRLKGPEYTAVAIGNLRLDSLALDAVAGLHTVTTAGAALGKIPGVQKFVKKHEDLLKATGLDQELKRFGIQIPTDQEMKPDTQTPVKTPVTVFVKLKGPASSPEAIPVLETAINKEILTRLKSLLY